MKKYFLGNLHNNLSQIQIAWLYYWSKFWETDKKNDVRILSNVLEISIFRNK